MNVEFPCSIGRYMRFATLHIGFLIENMCKESRIKVFYELFDYNVS